MEPDDYVLGPIRFHEIDMLLCTEVTMVRNVALREGRIPPSLSPDSAMYRPSSSTRTVLEYSVVYP